jgi:hypothetical protein
MSDSDEDGVSDLVEIAFAPDDDDVGQACDPTADISDDVDFFFDLPHLGDAQSEPLEFTVDVRSADVAFNIDSTGSMGGEIATLQSSLTSTIFPELSESIDNVAYGFSQFEDFPCIRGARDASPFILRQRMTTDLASAIVGVGALEQHGGGDHFESGFEARSRLRRTPTRWFRRARGPILATVRAHRGARPTSAAPGLVAPAKSQPRTGCARWCTESKPPEPDWGGPRSAASRR